MGLIIFISVQLLHEFT